MKYHGSLLASLTFFVAGSAFAARLSSDLSAATSTPVVVEGHQFQVETRAVDFIRSNKGFGFASLLAKYGIIDGADVEFNFDGFQVRPNRHGDAGLKAKVAIVSEEKYAISLIPFFSIPTYGNPFEASTDFGIIAPVSFRLGEKTEFGFQIAFQREANFANAYQASLKLEQKLMEQNRIYFEVSVSGSHTDLPVSAAQSNLESSLNFGFLRNISDDTELHLVANFGLNSTTTRVLLGAGGAFRF